VGVPVGALVGVRVGEPVGSSVSSLVGLPVGALVGVRVGDEVGSAVASGSRVGLGVGGLDNPSSPPPFFTQTNVEYSATVCHPKFEWACVNALVQIAFIPL